MNKQSNTVSAPQTKQESQAAPTTERVIRSAEETQGPVKEQAPFPAISLFNAEKNKSDVAIPNTNELSNDVPVATNFTVGRNLESMPLPGPADIELPSEKDLQNSNVSADTNLFNSSAAQKIAQEKSPLKNNSVPTATAREVLVYDSSVYFGLRVIDVKADRAMADVPQMNAVVAPVVQPENDLGTITAGLLNGSLPCELPDSITREENSNVLPAGKSEGISSLKSIVQNNEKTSPPRPGAIDFAPDLTNDPTFTSDTEIGFARSHDSGLDDAVEEMSLADATTDEEKTTDSLARDNAFADTAISRSEPEDAHFEQLANADDRYSASLHELPEVSENKDFSVASHAEKKSFWSSFEFPWSDKKVTKLQKSDKKSGATIAQSEKKTKSITSAFTDMFTLKSSKTTASGSSKSIKSAHPKAALKSKPENSSVAKASAGKSKTAQVGEFFAGLNPFSRK
ncbi:MAG: hypothetical protein Q4G68_04810 [Planctomycetia bacterium]|nr:hypothetical protein [Planctomycetia bacterium]